MQITNNTLNTFNLKTLVILATLALSSTSMHSFAASEAASDPSITTNSASQEATEDYPDIEWRIGPKKENIAEVASLRTLKGEGYLNTENSDIFLEWTGNLSTGSTNILMAEDDSWWATFEFDPSGYIQDNEKIDADKLLEELKSYDIAANKEREQLGLDKIYTVGWAVPPHYDEKTKQLEWALKIRDDENNIFINYTIRILGRTGVMSATLISDEKNLTENIAAFKTSLKGFEFNDGEKYSQFQAGDKVAEYGLAALVAGGAAAIATKKGLWGVIAGILAAAWKFIAVGVAAAGAWIMSIFKKKDK